MTIPQEHRALLARGGETIQMLMHKCASLEAENAQLLQEVQKYQRQDIATKVASAMDAQGLHEHLSFDQKVAGLLSLAPDDLNRTIAHVNYVASAKQASDAQLPPLGYIPDDNPALQNGSDSAISKFQRAVAAGPNSSY